MPQINPTNYPLLPSLAGDEYMFGVKPSGSGAGSTILPSQIVDLTRLNPLIANGGGIINVTTPFNTAVAKGQVFLPRGTYNLPTTDEFGSWRSWGFGQVKDNNGNKRAPFHASTFTPPASSGGADPETYFNGDLTSCQFPIEHWISGAATLGQPASGYLFTPEAYPFFVSMYNASGWNQSTSTNDGRTAAVVFHTKLFQTGQGDAVVYDADVFVTGARAGATHFLANPAGTIINGSVQAGSAGVLLNPSEFELIDGGFDVAAVGLVFNFDRTNDTGALSARWSGIRLQSIGSKAIDAGFQLTGPAKCGLDFTSQTFDADKNAISLPQAARVYFNSTVAGPISLPVPGSVYMDYNATDLEIKGAALQLGGVLKDSASAQLLTTRRTGWNAPTGALLRGTFDSGANLATTAQTLAALITDLRTHGLIST